MHIRLLYNPRSSCSAQGQWALAIGNFDGVHCGHQMVLQALNDKANELGLQRAVCVFEPQPLEFFRPDVAPMRLMGARDKIEALFAEGVDCVALCRFDSALSQMSPEAFLQGLRSALDIKAFVVGRDFRFGYQRQGDVYYLEEFGEKQAIHIKVLPDLTQDQQRISSSLVREYITQHKFKEAKQLLGRPYRLCGRVKYGQQLARKLGFPTANLHIIRKRPPMQGVFVGYAYLPYNGAKPRPAVANCGYKPTVNGTTWQVEVHVLASLLKYQPSP